jgi:MFS family permease
VSALAQVGQLGIVFVLFPLALQLQDAPAWQVGVVSSGLWAGILVGLTAAPAAIRRIGYGKTVGIGLLISVVALLCAPQLAQRYWAIVSLATGLGYGLRWIANETWLFGIVPSQSQGKIVGLHESLLGVAAIAGPALVAVLGAGGSAAFVIAAMFTGAAIVPLVLASSAHRSIEAAELSVESDPLSVQSCGSGVRQSGMLAAGIGGLIESSLISMFPLYASAEGIAASNIAWLLSVFGVGAVLLQLPIGWLADKHGVRIASVSVAALTAVCALAIRQVASSALLFGSMMFLMGGAITGLLTLAIVVATRQTNAENLAIEMRRVSIAFTSMSVVGPLVGGALVARFGGSSLMVLIALSASTLVLLISRRSTNPVWS